MPRPNLSPEEDALLRFGVVQAYLQSQGVHMTEFNKRIQGESADYLRSLVERRFLQSAGAARYVPTIHGQLYMSAYSLRAMQFLDGILDFGKRLLNSNNTNKSVGADQLAQAVGNATMLPLEDPGTRFGFDCSLYGLEPYINVVRASPEGRPLDVFFGARLLSIGTVEELLAKIDADEQAADERAAAKAKPPRERKRKRASRGTEAAPTVPQTVINVSGPVGAIQTGDNSRANVQQNVPADDGKASKRDG